ncbi:MAG: universal stress protein [Desulfurivibrionaceae bacterium]|nr:universal stress protein [Desulfobulbales bacterium]MDT8335031.1 universal stress protein [Desulfurivibrionaceae bacterium]
MEKRILVAVDGSIYSNNTVHYLGTLFDRLEEVRLHLLSLVPCGALPPEKEWMDELELLNTLPPEARKRLRSTKTYIKNATDKLHRLGINPERITTEIKLVRRSVADDIIDEARKGLFDALVIGRRGITKLEELIIGSASEAIFQKCHDVPIWIIDGRVDSRKFLVPIDGSICSMMAADHLAHIIEGCQHCQITLFHSSAMLSSARSIEPSDFYAKWGREWCEEHMSRPDSLFHAPKQLLVESGIPAENIKWLHSSKGIEASRQIIRQALIDDFGTIVIGRRSEDVKKGIFRGVSDRVVLMGDRVAIWIVG